MISTEQQRFSWLAILDDETSIAEFNDDGTENLYKDLPREQIKLFALQSPNARYSIDLTLGTFNVRDYKNDKKVNVAIPYKETFVNMCGFLENHKKYDFFCWKRTYTDFHPANLSPVNVNVIDAFLLGWQEQKHVALIGQRWVKTYLVIKNELNPAPQLVTELSLTPMTPPIDGSPFVMSL